MPESIFDNYRPDTYRLAVEPMADSFGVVKDSGGEETCWRRRTQAGDRADVEHEYRFAEHEQDKYQDQER